MAVRDVISSALAIYEIDVDQLRNARPDVIVTQDLCDVCAVSLDDVRAAVAQLAQRDVKIVNLHPTRLNDVWADIVRVADALGRRDTGNRVVDDLKKRAMEIERRAQRLEKPSIVSIEWIDPVMIGGLWMAELVALAGGTALMTEPGARAPTVTREQLSALDPDLVLIKPCGFDLGRTLDELPVLRKTLPWESWRAVASGRVYVADGNAFFNRPGPRIVESLEILAACAHPEEFEDFARKHAGSVVGVGSDLATRSITASGERS
jgi:iron complex transport system substrate-binding protein